MNNQPNYDVNFYIQKFIRNLKRRNYSPETIIGYTKDLKRFNEFIFQEYEGDISMEQIQKEDLIDYLVSLEESGLKPNSVSRHLSTLKSFFKFLVYDMNFKIDVASRIKHSNVYTPLPKILDVEEVQTLLKTTSELSTFYYVFFALIYNTGSRLTPIRILQKENIDLTTNQVYFERVKGGRDLHLPLNSFISKVLSDFISNHPSPESRYLFPSPINPLQPISPADVRLNLKKFAFAAGIEKRVTPHILRHCTATHLTIMGVDQKFIASVLNHSDLRSTARYQQLNVDNLRPTLEQLDSGRNC